MPPYTPQYTLSLLLQRQETFEGHGHHSNRERHLRLGQRRAEDVAAGAVHDVCGPGGIGGQTRYCRGVGSHASCLCWV